MPKTFCQEMKLHLIEESAWTGTLYELSIEGGVVSFTGFGMYRERFPGATTLREEFQLMLKDGLSFLEVSSWRDSYRPEDIGSVVDDGGSWRVELSESDEIVRSSGVNAYPSYGSAAITSLHEERFGLLREAVFSTIQLSPFGFRPTLTEAEQGVADQRTARCE